MTKQEIRVKLDDIASNSFSEYHAVDLCEDITDALLSEIAELEAELEAKYEQLAVLDVMKCAGCKNEYKLEQGLQFPCNECTRYWGDQYEAGE